MVIAACSGTGNRVPHFKTKLLAIFLYGYFVIILIFSTTFAACFSCVSSISALMMICLIFPCWFLVSCSWYFAWLGLSFFGYVNIYLYIYLLFSFPCLDCFDGIKHSCCLFLPPCSLMLFSTTVFLSHSTHPVSSSFLSPSAFLASGVKLYCEKTFSTKWKWS